jgi:antitoxin MazE
MTAKTRIVRIGNSRGIRVPKLLLDQANLPEEVELRAEPGRLVVTGAVRPRAGWAVKARSMRKRDDDVLLDPVTATRFDEAEWRWE